MFTYTNANKHFYCSQELDEENDLRPFLLAHFHLARCGAYVLLLLLFLLFLLFLSLLFLWLTVPRNIGMVMMTLRIYRSALAVCLQFVCSLFAFYFLEAVLSYLVPSRNSSCWQACPVSLYCVCIPGLSVRRQVRVLLSTWKWWSSRWRNLKWVQYSTVRIESAAQLGE